MVEKNKGSSQDVDRTREEICQEISDVLEGRKDVAALRQDGTLPPRLEKLIALSSVLTTQQGPDAVASCVTGCLELGATPQEIMQVLQKVVLMAEIPVETYTKMVRQAIEAFESR